MLHIWALFALSRQLGSIDDDESLLRTLTTRRRSTANRINENHVKQSVPA